MTPVRSCTLNAESLSLYFGNAKHVFLGRELESQIVVCSPKAIGAHSIRSDIIIMIFIFIFSVCRRAKMSMNCVRLMTCDWHLEPTKTLGLTIFDAQIFFLLYVHQIRI